jgi:hypothetical protein
LSLFFSRQIVGYAIIYLQNNQFCVRVFIVSS